jgi:adenylate cyclase
MFRTSKRTRRFVIGLMITVFIGLTGCLAFSINLFHGLHLQSGDLFYRAADSDATTGPDNNIAIIAIDDRSLDQLGRFSSWPRSYHARLIDSLVKAGARVIVFDILFSEPTTDDDGLAASIEQAGNVILPFAGNLEAQSPNLNGNTADLESVVRPLPAFEAGALATGHANILPDEDGIVRSLPVIIRNGADYEPALSLTAVARYLRRPQIIESLPEGNRLPFAGRSIPLENAGNMLINYPGGSSGSSDFATVSYVDVLNGSVTPDVLKDKIVIIGATATGLGDTFWTPLGRMMSGVEVHASAMETILAGDFLRPSSAAVTVAVIILLAFLSGLVVLRFRVLWGTLSVIALALLYCVTAFYFFDRGILLDMLYPLLAIAAAFTGINLYNVTSERLEKSEITRTFGRYVSPSIAKMILEAIDRGSLRLGGEERTVTVLFADARNFTGLSETVNPPELVSILNRYLSVIIKAVLQHGGMVNKFGGDSIMAVWNTPLACPDHALSAVKAALRAQEALRELQERAINLPRLEFGIGVNTGRAVAGNMGSIDRLEYSVIGDAVNTAARLAGVAPGSRVWAGAGAFDLIEGQVRATPLEPLSLKGKHETIKAYEVLEILKQPSGEKESALRLFRERQSVTNHESYL